jgi:arsenate reductase (thioredoxin)
MFMISNTFAMVMVARRQLLAGALLIGANLLAPAAVSAPPKKRRVLFICQFGTAKSAIARELMKRRAAERGVPLGIFSRGITPEPHLAPSTRDALLAEGIVLDAQEVQALSAEDLSAADIVVFFNPLPATWRKGDERDWSAVPSVNDAYPLARIELDRRIDNLISELVQQRP